MDISRRLKPTSPIRWMKITAVSLTIVIALLVVGVAYAATLVIDTFDTGTQSVVLLAAGTDQNSATGANILGGGRDIQATSLGGGFLVVGVDALNNRFDYGAGPSVRGSALIQWDGIDGDIALNVAGLCTTPVTDCADFTDNLANDSFVMRIISNDIPALIEIRAYTSLSDWSDHSFMTPGDILSGDVVDIVVPFNYFNDNGNGADWENIGALELFIDATANQDVDLSIDFLYTDSVRDYGDLPETGTLSYPGLTLLDDGVGGPGGARHITHGVRLGPNSDAQVDTETDGQPNALAGVDQTGFPGGDDGNPVGGPNDEDGINRVMTDHWLPDEYVHLIVQVYGCPDTCYLNGWIDWNRDGSFAEANDQIFSDEALANGDHILSVTVPSDYVVGDPVFSRYRLCPATGALPLGCNSTTGETHDGEVEDYWWDFDDPTAISLTNLEAKNSTPMVIVGASVLLLLVSGGALLVFKRRSA